MNPPGRPKSEYRRAQPEGSPVNAAGPLPRRSIPLGGIGAQRRRGLP